MSLEILEKVKNFLIKLVKDEDFRTQLMSDKIEDIKKAMADGGYNFSQAEFETAAIKILELKESGEFNDLSEEELVGAFGGLTILVRPSEIEPEIQPLYGVVYWPPEGYPKPHPRPRPRPIPHPILHRIKHPILQPLYGVVIDPPVQALYGVVAPEELQ
ncbi:MAG: Nif11-like leader peptide family RiPP precursor [Gloeotrichia echinulata DVL01]|jgi:predicted ribosomally synthesized peptide with nif11-like leader